MTKQKETTWSHTKALLPQIQEAYTAMCRNALSGGEISLKKFTLLLSGISTCRKTPGIPEHMGYEQMYVCNDEQAQEVRNHLDKLYGIKDVTSLEACCEHLFTKHREYVQFLSFWKEQPMFDLQDLQPEAKTMFEHFQSYAQLFYPFTQDKGFYAWDANEIIGLYRRAYACHLIDEEAVWKRCLPIARRVSSWYANWQEFALSSLCGALYFNLRNGGTDEEADGLFQLHMRLLQQLLSEGGAWGVHGWYQTMPKKFVKSKEEILQLLHDWEGGDGCIASDRILVDGCRIGYMYRQEPQQEWDSGWRFMAGDETQEYLDDPYHCGIYKLNTLCNYDPEIQPFLTDEVGSAYARKEDDLLHKISSKEA